MQGKHVVVTGATGSLGGAVVELLLARGAHVHVPIIEPELKARLAWRTNPSVHATPNVSLGDEAQVVAYYASLPPLWASIHTVGGFAMARLADTTAAAFEEQWRLNTLTCFLTCREAVKRIRPGHGRIVNVAARVVEQAPALMTAYTASKAGVAAITHTLAAELRDEGILVNAVLPSIIDTPPNRAAMPTADFGSWPKPAEIAEVIGFLASPANSLTSGALVPVYGRG
jgi:NAD(P)-dependent dehydrogenase (short-subunit alcohol dehydrogenase family)